MITFLSKQIKLNTLALAFTVALSVMCAQAAEYQLALLFN